MGALIKATRIGLVAALLSVLTGFPATTLPGGPQWGPTGCFAQENGAGGSNSEVRRAAGYVGNNFVGQVSILNNTVTDTNGFYSVRLLNAFQGFGGMVQVNQAAGMLNNQATYVGLAGFGAGASARSLRMSYLSRLQQNSLTISNSTYQARIRGPSFAGGAGLTLVNQASGHMNTQLSAFFLTMGTGAAHDLTDLQLGAISSQNTVTCNPDAPGVRAAELELDKGAFQNYTGIWGTSQVAGNLNQVTTIFNVRVTTVP